MSKKRLVEPKLPLFSLDIPKHKIIQIISPATPRSVNRTGSFSYFHYLTLHNFFIFIVSSIERICLTKEALLSDVNLVKIILNDDKEKAEHNTIVDLLRNDLSRVAKNVVVKRFRYIDKIKSNRGNLLQISSEIEGDLGDAYLDEIGTIIFKLLPTGSVSGAPKNATLDIIRNAEQQARGYYTGVAGYFDGNSFNSFVLIRFIEQENDRLYFRSGGGITAMSNAEKEYHEMLQKVYLPF